MDSFQPEWNKEKRQEALLVQKLRTGKKGRVVVRKEYVNIRYKEHVLFCFPVFSLRMRKKKQINK